MENQEEGIMRALKKLEFLHAMGALDIINCKSIDYCLIIFTFWLLLLMMGWCCWILEASSKISNHHRIDHNSGFLHWVI